MLALINDILSWGAAVLAIIVFLGAIIIFVVSNRGNTRARRVCDWVGIGCLVLAIELFITGIIGYILYSHAELDYCLATLSAIISAITFAYYNAKYRNCDYLEQMSK